MKGFTTYLRRGGVAAAALSLVWVAHSAVASQVGNQRGDITISPMGGYYKFDDRRKLKDEAMGNVALGYNFTRHFGIEGLVGLMDTRNRSSAIDKKDDAELYTLNAIYHFTPSDRFQPFALAGFAITFTLRFCAWPTAVSLLATKCVAPNPLVYIRLVAT